MPKFFLHAAWVSGKDVGNEELTKGFFFIWAEAESHSGNSRRSKRTRSAFEVKPHPFSATGVQLLSAVQSLTGKSKDELNASKLKLVLSIPSASGLPLPSPEASIFLDLGNLKPDNSKLEIRSWALDGVALPSSGILEIICNMKAEAEIVLCEDFKYWQYAARFVLRLLARHKFYPALVKGGENKHYSVWKLAVDEEEDVRLFESLASSMPASCLIFSSSRKMEIPSPKSLLNSFLFSVADLTIRRWVGSGDNGGSLIKELEEMSSLEKWWALLANSQNVGMPFNSDVVNLFKSVEFWLEPLKASEGAAPFRTVFKLEPPENGSSEWLLSFLLQDSADHSLIVDAGEVWDESGNSFRLLEKRFLNPQERLLSDLGKASKIFTPIERSLMKKKPSSFYLSTEEVYSFLSEYSFLLKESGFSVLVPSWWDEEKAQAKNKVGVRIKLSSSSGLLSLQSLVDFDWQLAIGEDALTLEEFENLARLKVPLVNVRGKWVVVRKEHVQEAIKQLKKIKASGVTAAEALKLSLGLHSAEIPLPVSKVDASGQFEGLVRSLRGYETMELVAQPKEFEGSLRPYQQKGVSWLTFLKRLGFGACLADDMGLGKTIQAIALLLHVRAQRNGRESMRPTLLICPTSVIGNWSREMSRFAPSLSFMVHHGSERFGAKQFIKQAANKDIVITSYSLSHRDEAVLSKVGWRCVILDEAQNIKNPFTKQASAIKKIKADFRLAMTGTPIENRLSELWSIFEFLNPSYLGSHEAFTRNFSIPVERYNDKEAAERLKSIVKPFVLRRLKTDKSIISDLPEKVESKVFCNLTKEQATLYEAVVMSSLKDIEESEGIKRKGAILAALTKLKQVCNHPSLFMHDKSLLEKRSGKLERLKEMLEEVLAEGYRALIFTQFAEMGELLKSYLQNSFGDEVLFLYGQTPRKVRDEMVHRFQNDPEAPKIFVLSLKAGGLGLNLTNANQVFHFDRWWNPAVENQATDRAFRIGQSRNVQVYKFVTLGTVEERIDALIEHKSKLSGSIISAGESWITELSTGQLREIFSLRKDSVYSDD